MAVSVKGVDLVVVWMAAAVRSWEQSRGGLQLVCVRFVNIGARLERWPCECGAISDDVTGNGSGY